jgi:NAD(P)-dependent dehydrogenase (short-subunit alcohol dehydrogenase family)
MRKQGGGSIVNITSNAGVVPGSGTVGYSAIYGVSKAALDRFTWALAAEEVNFIAVMGEAWGREH